MNEQLNNYLLLAETAKQGGNNVEALNYYNKILEVDPTVTQAWAGKGITILNTSKVGDIKSTEAIAYFKNAIKNSPSDATVMKFLIF
jgi:tetratricopeptide (TPR) repeat protein